MMGGGAISPLEEKVVPASVCVLWLADKRTDGRTALQSLQVRKLSGGKVAKARTLAAHLVMRKESSGRET